MVLEVIRQPKITKDESIVREEIQGLSPGSHKGRSQRSRGTNKEVNRDEIASGENTRRVQSSGSQVKKMLQEKVASFIKSYV